MRRRWARLVVVTIVVGMLAAQAVIPAAAAPQQYSFTFDRWWDHWDLPVLDGKTGQSWTWGEWEGSRIGEGRIEPYVEGVHEYFTDDGVVHRVDGERDVVYFDKARMEYWPDRNGDYPDQNPWKVTTGLLATELMTGKLQLGNTKFEQHHPSQVPVAGDPNSGDITPSYADLGTVMDYKAIPAGWKITQTINANGHVAANQQFADYSVRAQDVGSPTGHRVASVFWAWMNQTGILFDTHPIDVVGNRDRFYTEKVFPNPFYATGYPTTEAYWTKTRVNGAEKTVLVQCFQRRCMTYTPSNAPKWQVEMGNVGQHYYHWRYVEIPAETSSASSLN